MAKFRAPQVARGLPRIGNHTHGSVQNSLPKIGAATAGVAPFSVRAPGFPKISGLNAPGAYPESRFVQHTAPSSRRGGQR